eukprot:TRINITY_DN16396_c0_g1_i3.p1 TRINITY_DN16396_c0_g1~~TRINITY_DN16396_c0_g1_i3.p1  ORF type:complete len:956 (+),score=209.60 TRINITY_DN16396_c0_g1_i3:77-2944(+)
MRAVALLGLLPVVTAVPVLDVDDQGRRVFKSAMLLGNSPQDFTWFYGHNKGRLLMIDYVLKTYANVVVNSTFEVYPEHHPAIPGLLTKWGEAGYHLVITTSTNFKLPTLDAAHAFPGTNWVHIHSSPSETGPTNFASAWCRIYQARYLTGIAAASQTVTKKIGFVAAIPTVQLVLRGINSFVLGVRKLDPTIRTYVNFIYTFTDPERTEYASEWLRLLDCDVIGTFTNDRSAYTPFVSRGLRAAGYHSDMREQIGDEIVQSAFFNWGPMYQRFADEVLTGKPMTKFYFDGTEKGVPVVSEMTQYVPAATRSLINHERARLLAGEDEAADKGSSMIFCGPLKDEYGDWLLRNRSDCMDLDSHPKMYHQSLGGLLGMRYLIEGIEDCGRVRLPRELCEAGHWFQLKPEGKLEWVNTFAQHPNSSGRLKIRMAYTCEECPEGEYQPLAGNSSCVKCPAGTYSEGAAVECTPCPVGFYAGEVGSGACTVCPQDRTTHTLGSVECDIHVQQQSWISRRWWILLVVVGGAGITAAAPVVWAFTVQQRRIRHLHNNNTVAEKCAESIAAMRLEEVEYILRIERPNRIQQAFVQIITVLREYRTFLPQQLLYATDPSNFVRDHEGPATEESPTHGGVRRVKDVIREDHRRNTSQCNSPAASHHDSQCETISVSNDDTSLSSMTSHHRRPSCRVSRCALDKLEVGELKRKRVSVLWFGLNGFHRLANSSSNLVKEHSAILTVLHEQCRTFGGVQDHMSGDRLVYTFATYHTSSICGPRQACIQSAMRIEAEVGALYSEGASIGTSTGSALVGTLGTREVRRPQTVGVVMNRAFAFCRAARNFRAGVISCQDIYDQAHAHVLFRAVAVWTGAKIGKGVVLFQALKEREEFGTEEWMYQLRRAAENDPFVKYNEFVLQKVRSIRSDSHFPQNTFEPELAMDDAAVEFLTSLCHGQVTTTIGLDQAF